MGINFYRYEISNQHIKEITQLCTFLFSAQTLCKHVLCTIQCNTYAPIEQYCYTVKNKRDRK